MTERFVAAAEREFLSADRPAHVPETLWDSWRQAGGVVQVNHYYHTDLYQPTEERQQVFKPIGFLLTSLYRRLAWADETMRRLAGSMNVGGAGSNPGPGGGVGRMWPLNVLSPNLVRKLLAEKPIPPGSVLVQDLWDEWGTSFL